MNEMSYYNRLAFAITPSDTVDLAVPAKAVRCGTGGTLTFYPMDKDTSVTITLAANETFSSCIMRRIFATGTTANPLVGFGG